MTDNTRNFLIRLANTGLNPLEWTNILKIKGNSKTGDALVHGAALATTLGAATALARSAMREPSKSREGQLRAWAAAKHPVMSIDNSLRDSKREQKFINAGVKGPIKGIPELGKESKDDDEPSLLSKIPNPLNLAGAVAGGDFSTEHPTIALVSALAGIYGGYKLSDYVTDANRTKELESQIHAKQDNIDKLIYNEYKRTRGLSKAAKEIDPESIYSTGSVVDELKKDPTRSLSRTGSTWYTLWVVASAALAYKYSKMYTDSQDPARAREKQLNEVARGRARQTDAPIILDASTLPDVSVGSRKIRQAAPKVPAQITTVPGRDDELDGMINP